MEKELLLRQQEQLYGIHKLLKSGQINLDEITCLIPGVLHLNEIQTLHLTYLDKRSREILEVSEEDVAFNGIHILKDVVKPHSFIRAKKLLRNIDFNDSSKVVSHFQEIRYLSEKNSYEWFYSVKKNFDDNNLITISNCITSLGEVQNQVKKVLEENLFLRKNMSKVNSLTGREKEIIKLVFKGYNSNKIAEMLFLSPHTVHTHRKNIKNKLDIKNYKELFKIAVEFDLV